MTSESKPVQLERFLVDAVASDDSKYATINSPVGIDRFGIGPLQRRSRGSGDYYVPVYDRHSNTREEVTIPQNNIDAFVNSGGEGYSALVTSANELAPFEEREFPHPTSITVKTPIMKRIWNSKPIRNLRFATLAYGVLGALVFIPTYGGITGYRLSISDLDQVTAEVKADAGHRSNWNGRMMGVAINQFKDRKNDLSTLDSMLKDKVISDEEGDSYESVMIGYRLNGSPINKEDLFYDRLCDLIRQVRSEIQNRRSQVPRIDDVTSNLGELLESEALTPEEKCPLYSTLGALKEKHQRAVDAIGIRIDSGIGMEIADQTQKYKEFMDDLERKGYFDKLVQNEVDAAVRNPNRAPGIILGTLAGIVSWATPLVTFVLYEERKSKRKKEEPVLDYVI